jgi:hypothetical protein
MCTRFGRNAVLHFGYSALCHALPLTLHGAAAVHGEALEQQQQQQHGEALEQQQRREAERARLRGHRKRNWQRQ